jgi:Ca-activated chloride channel homolog
MIKFQHFQYLYALLALVPLLLLFVWYVFSRKKAIGSFGKDTLMQKLMPDSSSKLHVLKFILPSFALIFLIIGWANPQIGTKYETVQREGVDVIIALDVSKSMLAKDVTPQRLAKSKQFISNLIDRMYKDRIGLIVFAGNAYLQMPLTVDYSAARMYLKSISTDMIPTQGTAIAEAVNLATRSFQQDEDKHKTLIIISDGEDHEGDADRAIENALKSGVIVHTIGVGSDKGAPIPINAKGDFLTDKSGNIVLTRLNEKMLIEMAQKGKGKYFNIETSALADKIINELSGMEGKFLEEKVITDYKSRFPIFLSIAFALLLLEFLIPNRKIRIFKSLSK